MLLLSLVRVGEANRRTEMIEMRISSKLIGSSSWREKNYKAGMGEDSEQRSWLEE